jgi:plasmid stabilization system protein ParE
MDCCMPSRAWQKFPAKGTSRPDLTNHDVLFFGVYQYPIAYRRTRLVEIAAVLHGKRDAKRLPATRTAL